MARRRFQDNRPMTCKPGLTALIVMGVGLTVGASLPHAFWHSAHHPVPRGRNWLSGRRADQLKNPDGSCRGDACSWPDCDPYRTRTAAPTNRKKKGGEGWLYSEQQQKLCHFKPDTPSVHALWIAVSTFIYAHRSHRCHHATTNAAP